MLGLLRLEFEQYKREKRYSFIYIAYLIGMLVLTRTIKDLPYILLGIVFLKNIVMIQTSLQRDESNNWEVYRLSFPIRKKEVIWSKYIVLYLKLLLDIILYTGLASIILNNKLDYILFFKWVFLYSVMANCIISIFIPVFYKLGFIKSNNINVILILALSFLVYRYMNIFGFNLDFNIAVYLSLGLLSIISLVLSFKLSLSIYKKRDL